MAYEREKDGTLREWHPIEDIRSLAESMCRALDGVPCGSGRNRPPLGYRAPERKLSIRENRQGFVVAVELPEVSKKDLHLNVSESSVTIFARWSKEAKAKEKNGSGRVEHAEQMYSRVVQLPAPVKVDEARATFKDRLLRIYLPRAKPSQVRRIEVR